MKPPVIKTKGDKDLASEFITVCRKFSQILKDSSNPALTQNSIRRNVNGADIIVSFIGDQDYFWIDVTNYGKGTRIVPGIIFHPKSDNAEYYGTPFSAILGTPNGNNDSRLLEVMYDGDGDPKAWTMHRGKKLESGNVEWNDGNAISVSWHGDISGSITYPFEINSNPGSYDSQVHLMASNVPSTPDTSFEENPSADPSFSWSYYPAGNERDLVENHGQNIFVNGIFWTTAPKTILGAAILTNTSGKYIVCYCEETRAPSANVEGAIYACPFARYSQDWTKVESKVYSSDMSGCYIYPHIGNFTFDSTAKKAIGIVWAEKNYNSSDDTLLPSANFMYAYYKAHPYKPFPYDGEGVDHDNNFLWEVTGGEWDSPLADDLPIKEYTTTPRIGGIVRVVITDNNQSPSGWSASISITVENLNASTTYGYSHDLQENYDGNNDHDRTVMVHTRSSTWDYTLSIGYTKEDVESRLIYKGYQSAEYNTTILRHYFSDDDYTLSTITSSAEYEQQHAMYIDTTKIYESEIISNTESGSGTRDTRNLNNMYYQLSNYRELDLVTMIPVYVDLKYGSYAILGYISRKQGTVRYNYNDTVTKTLTPACSINLVYGRNSTQLGSEVISTVTGTASADTSSFDSTTDTFFDLKSDFSSSWTDRTNVPGISRHPLYEMNGASTLEGDILFGFTIGNWVDNSKHEYNNLTRYTESIIEKIGFTSETNPLISAERVYKHGESQTLQDRFIKRMCFSFIEIDT